MYCSCHNMLKLSLDTFIFCKWPFAVYNTFIVNAFLLIFFLFPPHLQRTEEHELKHLSTARTLEKHKEELRCSAATHPLRSIFLQGAEHIPSYTALWRKQLTGENRRSFNYEAANKAITHSVAERLIVRYSPDYKRNWEGEVEGTKVQNWW